MNVTLSIAAVTGVITIVLVWTKRVGPGTATVVWLSGLTAASTGLAGPVNDMLGAIVTAVSHH
ncbi:hypothetical protein PUR71_39565 [Streptomyces sp. SP17BM10]|uniref:hypothetical protein n=1 Tax=Streptomyces sp. SP17BM10 TaxID=3002530 RepID=UPI002E7765BB|nr:hypothetical protein [Streptomyces sp. SP17BM10]MEE1788957.1 hypothetical protein [Streptomyces sp. SP17BM10]